MQRAIATMNPESITATNAAQQPFMPLVRELVKAYQAFEAFDSNNLKRYDLTSPQADVIFTLGNTAGMVFKEIGEHTLITKGTLTGIVDRLEKKGLVKRKACTEDRRRMFVMLTQQGENVFRDVFPQHITHLKKRFDQLSQSETTQAITLLTKIRNLF